MSETNIDVTLGNSPISVSLTPFSTGNTVVDYSFTATAGQTVFTLPYSIKANGMFTCNINGAPQDIESGDYTVSGTTLTFTEALDAGDKVYGQFAIA